MQRIPRQAELHQPQVHVLHGGGRGPHVQVGHDDNDDDDNDDDDDDKDDDVVQRGGHPGDLAHQPPQVSAQHQEVIQPQAEEVIPRRRRGRGALRGY